MEVFTGYLLQNWALILILLAFAIMLFVTVFLDKKTIRRLSILIISVFAISIIVYAEFYLAKIKMHNDIRITLMAIRYSATPLIIAFLLYTLVKKARWYVFIPAIIITIINIISIFTGIVFSIGADGELVRGPVLGYLPYVGVGVYFVVFVVVLIWQSNKQATEIIPITFLAFAFISGFIFPFIIGKEYSQIFATTIAIGLFVYYVFLILRLTKKDTLTGLYNRQAYYAAIRNNPKDINAIISIDMNGLKTINDNEGHLAGDEALLTLANCFMNVTKAKQPVFRIGGDEFAIVCKKTSEEELKQLVENIKNEVSQTKYRCSIGYCYSKEEIKEIEEMAKKSDEMMYADKADYYSKSGIDRRNR